MVNDNEFPIDILYLWCDYDEKKHGKGNEVFFKSLDELKYSLRSLEANVPWIRKVFILTDNQKPDWIDESKVTIVDHKDVIPDKYRPTYNSATIDHFIWNIPEMSDNFLFANDDMFFGKPSKPSNWFYKKDIPFIRLYKTKYGDKDGKKTTFETMLSHALKLTGENTQYREWHGISAYNKETYRQTYEKFKDNIDKSITLGGPFRSRYTIQRLLYDLDAIHNNKGHLIDVKGYYKDIMLYYDNLYIEKDKHLSFCINGVEEAYENEDGIRELKEYMEYLFPNKSRFEL